MERPRIHSITVEGGWDGVLDHAINFEITVDLVGVPGTELVLLSCDDPLVESIDVLSIISLESEEHFTLSPEAAPRAPENTPTELQRPILHKNESMIVEHGSVPDSPNVSPSKSAGKAVYFPGVGMAQSHTRRRLFPPSPLASSPEIPEFVPEDRIKSASSPSRIPRKASTSSTYLDIPAIEMDPNGVCHILPPPREPSAETVNIYVSRPSSTGSVMINKAQLNPLARIFSPDVEARDIIIKKSGGRAFGDSLENRSLRIMASPLLVTEADSASKASVPERSVVASPFRFKVEPIPARSSSRIPLKSPKKDTSPPKDSSKPSWRYPATEEIIAHDRRPVSPTKVTSPTEPSTPENKKYKQNAPVQSATKKSLPHTPQKQIAGVRSLENISISYQKGSNLKRETMTIGRMAGPHILDRDRDMTVKGNRFGSPPAPAHEIIPRWLADDKDCVGLGLAPSLIRESESSLQSLSQSAQLDQSFGIESGDSASNWDPIFDEVHGLSQIETSDETSLLPSPTASSQRMVPWTSSKPIGYRPSTDILGKLSPDSFNWVMPIFPIAEYADGNLLISFPRDYNTGTCRVVLCANLFAGQKGAGGWQNVTIPKLPTQEAQWGTLSLCIALDDDPPPIEFKSQGLRNLKIESESISGFFDSTIPLVVEVRSKEAIHHLEKFEIYSDIQCQYEWDEEAGLWVHYTASCVLREFDENFAADECKFALFVCNGPPSVMIRSFGAGNRSISFDREGVTEAGKQSGGMEIFLVCPSEEIWAPFTVTWTAYLGTPPVSVAMPKICAQAIDGLEVYEDEERALTNTLSCEATESFGSAGGLFRMTRTSPPKLRTNPIQPPLGSGDMVVEPLADKVSSIMDEADDELSQDNPVQDPVVSSPRKPGGKKLQKTRRHGLHGIETRVPTLIIHHADDADAIPKVAEKATPVKIDMKGNGTVKVYRQGISGAIMDIINDVIEDPVYAVLDIFGGLLHVVMKIVVSGLICFVDFFLPKRPARATRGVVSVFKIFFRFVFIVCMLPLVNNVKDRAAVTVMNEWKGKTNYLGQGTEVAREVVHWVIEKAPMVKIEGEGETSVEMLDEEIIPTVTVSQTQTQEVSRPTYTPTLMDRLDWMLGWRGPFEE